MPVIPSHYSSMCNTSDSSLVCRYSLDCIPNASDHSGRYKYGSQPAIGQWNIAALASLFVDDVPTADLQSVVNSFTDSFNGHFTRLLRAKLGLDPVDSSARDDLVCAWFLLFAINFKFALTSLLYQSVCLLSSLSGVRLPSTVDQD